MNANEVYRKLSPQERFDVLVGLGASSLVKRKDLLGGGLARFGAKGKRLRAALSDLSLGSLYHLGELYASKLKLE
jgi:hypothetical protein